MSLEMLERALPALTGHGTDRLTGRGTDRADDRARRPGPARPAARTPGPGGAPALACRVDWSLVTRALGTRLPQDYVQLVCRYQGLVIDDWLGIRMPRPGLEQWYVDGVREHLLELESAWMTGDSGGHVPFPRPRGLLPWGGSIQGDTFYWRTHPDGPEAWTVVVCGSSNDFMEVPRDLTGYLAGLLRGEIAPCSGLPADFPDTAPSISLDAVRTDPQVG